MEICFPEKEASRVKKVRTRRELPATTPLSLERSANETEMNVTVSILVDIHVKKVYLTVAGVALHSYVEAKYLGFRRK